MRAQLTALPLRRASWVGMAEHQLRMLQLAGHPSPVEELVTSLAEQWQVSPSQARSEVERNVDLASVLSPGMGTPMARSVAHTPTASPQASPLCAAWATPMGAHYARPHFPPTTPVAAADSSPGQCSDQDLPSATRSRRRAQTYGGPAVQVKREEPARISVAVIAPGAGTGINGAVYTQLGRDPRFQVEVVGRSRAPYDVYPPCWPQGSPAPNLESFAEEVRASRVTERSNCLVFGSRGGQVVLPYLWQAQAQFRSGPVPPAVVINGGCAMNLPTGVSWPEDAITFILLGGQDNFRGHFGVEEYVAETRSHVPKANATTAILYVNEMTHMPQQNLLASTLPWMIRGLSAWEVGRQPPLSHFRSILSSLSKDGWSGRLLYTSGPGNWEDIKFSHFDVGKLQVAPLAAPAGLREDEAAPEPMEFTASDELKALWKAAAVAARPGHGAPFVQGHGNRFAAVVSAAVSSGPSGRTDAQRPVLTLPVGAGAEAVRGGGYAGGRPLLAVPSPHSHTPDPTPISRALGLPGRSAHRHASMQLSSPGSSPGNGSPCFYVNDPSPSPPRHPQVSFS
mmetsp:Transcript_79894/g.144196  ORF Transcript_79894/g.144196 Transcript_79894/m.144196 type:complete len:567 (-) Transcript_79894:805-2505(-)